MNAPHRGASELLGHFIPASVMMQARELARKFKRDEIVSAYAEKRKFLVVSAGLSCMLSSALFVAGLLLFLFRVVEPQPSLWLAATLLILPVAIWLGSTIFLLYLFFDWLEEKALAETGSTDKKNE